MGPPKADNCSPVYRTRIESALGSRPQEDFAERTELWTEKVAAHNGGLVRRGNKIQKGRACLHVRHGCHDNKAGTENGRVPGPKFVTSQSA